MSQPITAYSAYPHEQEHLLMEGTRVWVLAIEHDVKIVNEHLPQYNAKTVTIVYVYNSW